MELIINHRRRTFHPAPPSLETVIRQELDRSTKGIAVAVNNQVIPKANWADTPLREADQILIITATQGG